MDVSIKIKNYGITKVPLGVPSPVKIMHLFSPRLKPGKKKEKKGKSSPRLSVSKEG